MSRGSSARPLAGRHHSTPTKMGPAVWSRDGVLPLPGIAYFDHLNTLLPDCASGPVPNGGAPYPDAEPPQPGDIVWLPGAFEGVMSLRGPLGSGPEPMLAAAAIAEACRKPLCTIAVHTVADRLAALPEHSDVDRLLGELRIDSVVGRVRLAELARWLCRFGTRLRHVQAGLALLATVGGRQDRLLVLRLGLLDTVTMRAVEALRGILLDPEPALFVLAKQTHGWGRIHAVRGLRGTTRPDIQDWLLRGGYVSGVIDEELAGIAVISGDLAGALQGDVDAELLHHAGHLLETVCAGGPVDVEGLDDYPEGGLALEMYLHCASDAPPTVEILSVAQSLDDYLKGYSHDNRHLDDFTRSRLLRLVSALLARPVWREAAATALRSPSIVEFRPALHAAIKVGIDVRPFVQERLESNPTEPFLWTAVLKGVPSCQAVQYFDRAECLLNPASRATGASTEQWPSDPVDRCLAVVLSQLANHPGMSWPLIANGLEHPVVRIRRTALRALEAWPTSSWPVDARPLLERLRWVEPDRALRALFVELSVSAPAPEERKSNGGPARS